MESYLPEDMSFSKVVGLGMNADEMGANSRLTDRIVQNLNAKVRNATQGELGRAGGGVAGADGGRTRRRVYSFRA